MENNQSIINPIYFEVTGSPKEPVTLVYGLDEKGNYLYTTNFLEKDNITWKFFDNFERRLNNIIQKSKVFLDEDNLEQYNKHLFRKKLMNPEDGIYNSILQIKLRNIANAIGLAEKAKILAKSNKEPKFIIEAEEIIKHFTPFLFLEEIELSLEERAFNNKLNLTQLKNIEKAIKTENYDFLKEKELKAYFDMKLFMDVEEIEMDLNVFIKGSCLRKAVQNGDVKKVKSLIRLGAPKNFVSREKDLSKIANPKVASTIRTLLFTEKRNGFAKKKVKNLKQILKIQ